MKFGLSAQKPKNVDLRSACPLSFQLSKDQAETRNFKLPEGGRFLARGTVRSQFFMQGTVSSTYEPPALHKSTCLSK